MTPQRLTIPDPALVLLIGPSGCGKSTFARKHFRVTEVISSDTCRAWVSDDEANQDATADAFDVLHFLAGKRLKRGRLTVIDATNVQARARQPLIELAQRYQVPAVALVLDVPERICQERNRQRADRQIPAHAIHRQVSELRQSLRELGREGFAAVHVLRGPEAIDAMEIVRERHAPDLPATVGPFDIIGDVHGCYNELVALLRKLSYTVSPDENDSGAVTVTPPAGRRVVFVGDLVDRGPKIPQTLRLAMGMIEAGTALAVVGNHDDKLLRALRGNTVKIVHGLADSLEQLAPESEIFRNHVVHFFDQLATHLILDDGRLVIAHAGLPERLHGRDSKAVRSFALYGDVTGAVDAAGYPIRRDWARDYRGQAAVVYGHTVVDEPTWVNNTINIDTGCVFGGRLTALRYPERELVSVPAMRVYAERGASQA